MTDYVASIADFTAAIRQPVMFGPQLEPKREQIVSAIQNQYGLLCRSVSVLNVGNGRPPTLILPDAAASHKTAN